jgi:hypothetical protein
MASSLSSALSVSIPRDRIVHYSLAVQLIGAAGRDAFTLHVIDDVFGE